MNPTAKLPYPCLFNHLCVQFPVWQNKNAKSCFSVQPQALRWVSLQLNFSFWPKAAEGRQHRTTWTSRFMVFMQSNKCLQPRTADCGVQGVQVHVLCKAKPLHRGPTALGLYWVSATRSQARCVSSMCVLCSFNEDEYAINRVGTNPETYLYHCSQKAFHNLS